MSIELKIPPVGESITEVTIGAWRKEVGAAVSRDEELVELETDKATFDLPSPVAGVIGKILKRPGETATVGEVVGLIDESPGGGTAKQTQSPSESQTSAPAPKGQKAPEPSAPTKSSPPHAQATPTETPQPVKAAPSPNQQKAPAPKAPAKAPPPIDQATPAEGPPSIAAAPATVGPAGREERVVPMSPIRRRIAERLVEAQRDAALLTTFNEIDMSAVMALRKKYRDSFQAAYGVKLGFMSFFVKAVVDALSEVPQLNAEIRGDDIVFRNYYDIGVAIGGGKGLVVPVLRNAERLSFAEIERQIADFGARAGENKIKLEELQGGTFTISNGGVYGSLLSTPIVNPPQSGVLGMHAIQERPVVRDGTIVIRPMMYVALTYDHRIVDGREAVTFLARVRDIVEDPSRLLIEI
jgi:2-oxoglutarate dehydrogenase E2 component (dihydrolipoamide succinyltransferase)